MVVNLTMEEELRIEQQARSILASSDESQVRDLCAALSKQNAFQQKLIKQAVRHISELELKAELSELQDVDPVACAHVRRQFGFDDSDRSHPDGTQDQNLLLSLALKVLGPVLWALGYALGLLEIARRTMSRVRRGF
jgi:hypothetical protein